MSETDEKLDKGNPEDKGTPVHFSRGSIASMSNDVEFTNILKGAVGIPHSANPAVALPNSANQATTRPYKIPAPPPPPPPKPPQQSQEGKKNG